MKQLLVKEFLKFSQSFITDLPGHMIYLATKASYLLNNCNNTSKKTFCTYTYVAFLCYIPISNIYLKEFYIY